MKIRIINDIHTFGPLQSHTVAEIAESILSSEHLVYQLGDNVDLKNAHKSKVEEAKQAMRYLSELSPSVSCNHGLSFIPLPAFIMLNDGQIFLTHGHLYTNYEKYSKWTIEHKKPGAGFLKRKILTPIVDKLRRFKEVKPNSELVGHVERLKKAYPNLKYFVMGHSHALSQKTYMIAGVRVIMLPRGINDLELV
jgi:predicted phosphodiesterase